MAEIVGHEEIVEILKEALANGRQPHLAVTSNSMTPLIKTGNQICLAKTTPSQLLPGDIITIEKESYLLTHRFYSLSDTNRLITKGDRPLQFDPPAKESKLIGKVIAIQQNGNYLPLDQGSGKMLNQHMHWLAKVETKLYKRHFGGQSKKGRTSSVWLRIVRRIIFSWKALSIRIVFVIFSQKAKTSHNAF